MRRKTEHAPATASAEIEIGKRTLKLSNLHKPLYPSGFMKADVIDYYARIAPFMLPHLKGRAITLKRYPDGSDKPFFYEKNCPSHRPPWMATVKIASTRSNSGDSVNHCVINEAAGLVWAANLASLELHVPMARADKPERPTAVVFDLDPGAPAMILDCARLALRMRDDLQRIGLESFMKTSGNKGLHLYIPLNTGRSTSDEAKSFAKAIAEHFAQQSPSDVTATMTRSLRKGKVFIDWSQNDQHKTTVCVYSLRATPTPMVSAPITWDELADALKKRAPARFQINPEEVFDRANSEGDVFEPILRLKQRLPT